MQIEQELNELHRRKLSDLEEKHEQILSQERYEHENRVQILLNKLDQMKNEVEQIQSTTNAERQDLAKKLQDVFETTLFKNSMKPNFSQPEIMNKVSGALTSIPSSGRSNQISLPNIDTQVKTKTIEFLPAPIPIMPLVPLTNNDLPTNMSAIRSLSSRIDSLVDQTNRVANGFELNSHLPPQSTQLEANLQKLENNLQKLESNQK